MEQYSIAGNEKEAVKSELEQSVGTIYQECWDEFYQWERGYCRSALESLGNGVEELLLSETIWKGAELGGIDERLNTRFKLTTIQDIKARDIIEVKVPITNLVIPVTFPPVPPYQFCMPISQSVPAYQEHEHVKMDDDGRDTRGLWLYFCPFTDADESFSAAQRRRLLEAAFADWEEQKIRDPDCKSEYSIGSPLTTAQWM